MTMGEHSGIAETSFRFAAPDPETIPGLLARNARAMPNVLAAAHGYNAISWASLANRAFAIAGRLRRAGIRPGDRVAFLCRNRLGIDDVSAPCGNVSAATFVAIPADSPPSVRCGHLL